ncbi:hypothetical protein [Streptomyces sp. NPDC048639]|uniref:hypothetical protein n=1 Tax=Streptomyces sp. NPDC048639 TaxID=3365581 RepID=UPI003719E63A
MGWRTEAFGESHEGTAGAVLEDCSEPKPVYLDFCSGADSVLWTSEWWAYTGQLRRPKAAGVRGACACGWRGPTCPIDWTQLEDDRLENLGTSAAHEDWTEHIRTVEQQTVPLPTALTELLDQLETQLTTLADQAPLAALKAVATLDRLTRRVGREAAYAAEADELSPETIGTALGLSPDKARSRLTSYLLRR